MSGVERKIAYIFPGQGTQKGGGADQSLVQLEVVIGSCFLLDYGKKTNSLLADLKPDYFAGHSVGKWSAIYAASKIDYETLLEAVSKRAALMETVGPGRMAAIIGRDWYQARGIWLQQGISLAVINCPGQFVISGKEDDVLKASVLARQQGMRSLDVRAAGPNHSDLMRSIQPQFKEYIEGLSLNETEGLIMLNTSGLPTNSTALIREELVAHLSRTVQWEQSVRNMILMGVNIFIEWGSDTLSKFIARIDPGVRTISIIDKQQAEMLVL